MYGVESFKMLYAGELARLCLEIEALQLDVFRWRRKQEYIWSGSSGPVPGKWQQRRGIKELLLCSVVGSPPAAAGRAGAGIGTRIAQR